MSGASALGKINLKGFIWRIAVEKPFFEVEKCTKNCSLVKLLVKTMISGIHMKCLEAQSQHC